MSHEKNHEEAKRWLVTGKDDLDTAIILKWGQSFMMPRYHPEKMKLKKILAWHECHYHSAKTSVKYRGSVLFFVSARTFFKIRMTVFFS